MAQVSPAHKSPHSYLQERSREKLGDITWRQKLQVNRHILSPPRWCLSCDHACQGPCQNGLLKRMPSKCALLCPLQEQTVPANPSWCSDGFYPGHSVVSLAWPTIAFPQDDELCFQLTEDWKWTNATALLEAPLGENVL